MKKRKRSKTKASFDRYAYYQKSVQAPEADTEFLRDTYKELRGRWPTILREDFCGTFAISCAWVKQAKQNVALGLDLDPEPLDYGRQNNLLKLRQHQRERVHIFRGNVMTAKLPKADIIAAMNFSYFIFKERKALVRYLRRCRQNLTPGGLLVLDAFGGSSCMHPVTDRTKVGSFVYLWEQKLFDPISHHALFHIHFKLPGEKIRRAVFTYDWRMWTLPEIRDALLDAGFKKTHVYWEGTKPNGEGDGQFRRTESGDNSETWIAYVVGES